MSHLIRSCVALITKVLARAVTQIVRWSLVNIRLQYGTMMHLIEPSVDLVLITTHNLILMVGICWDIATVLVGLKCWVVHGGLMSLKSL